MSLWLECVTRLKSQLSASEFGMWIQPLQASCSGEGIEIYAPNAFVLEWVKKHYSQEILQLLEGLSSQGRAPAVSFMVGTQPEEKGVREGKPPYSAQPLASRYGKSRENAERNAFPGLAPNRRSRKLNEKWNFQSFVVGACNHAASEAAKQASEHLGQVYNPLFLYGQSGLGKTHLLHAIGNHLLTLHEEARVIYLHSERFVQSMISSLQRGGVEQFRRQYEKVDLLLIDDLQFFCRKLRSQEELLYLFDRLMAQKTQVVLASDRSPQKIQLSEALLSRLHGGLSVELTIPTLETRASILCKKAEEQGVPIPETVLQLIAEKTSSNVRELEGALTRVIAGAKFKGVPITHELALSVLQEELWSPQEPSPLSPSSIQERVAEYYKISVELLKGRSRSRSVSHPRQVAMALTKELSDLSLAEIGQAFGGRDHTTVLYACRIIAMRRKIDRGFYQSWAKLRRSLI